ncbi:MAG: extracellular solute-binding protein [bacterium]
MKKITRRTFLKSTAAAGGMALGGGAAQAGMAPRLLRYGGPAAERRQADYLNAKIDWRQVDGERIKVLALPAHYIKKFQTVTSKFKDLTGIQVDYELIPPREMREKAILDLGAKTANYASQTTDPMYYHLYEANRWVDPLDDYLNDDKLTDKAWYDVDDVVPLWRAHDSVKGKLYGMPISGEATIHHYRADVYDKLGLRPPDTLEEFRTTAKRAHKHDGRMAGAALRGFRGAGQNMYIWPSLFRTWDGEWFDSSGRPTVNSEAGYKSLEFYVDILQNYSSPGVQNWNWPEIMEAFAAGNVVQFIDASTMAAITENPGKSKVAGKIAYQRWPKGPTGKRVTSIWNWGLPINGALSRRKKVATWLYIQWISSRPIQLLSATIKESPDAVVRTDVNRVSLWTDPEYRKVINFHPDYANVVLTSLEKDTDADWRPRSPQWPKIGEILAVAIQAALVKQKTVKKALDDANRAIAKVMRV